MKAKTAIRYYGKPFDTFPLDDIPGAPLVLCYRVSDLKKYLSRKNANSHPPTAPTCPPRVKKNQDK